jgi:uncharacterized protein
MQLKLSSLLFLAVALVMVVAEAPPVIKQNGVIVPPQPAAVPLPPNTNAKENTKPATPAASQPVPAAAVQNAKQELKASVEVKADPTPTPASPETVAELEKAEKNAKTVEFAAKKNLDIALSEEQAARRTYQAALDELKRAKDAVPKRNITKLDAKIDELSLTANHTAVNLQQQWTDIKNKISKLPAKEYSRLSGVILAVRSHVDDPVLKEQVLGLLQARLNSLQKQWDDIAQDNQKYYQSYEKHQNGAMTRRAKLIRTRLDLVNALFSVNAADHKAHVARTALQETVRKANDARQSHENAMAAYHAALQKLDAALAAQKKASPSVASTAPASISQAQIVHANENPLAHDDEVNRLLAEDASEESEEF